MIRKQWIFAVSAALTLVSTQRAAIAQYGPPTSGSSAAILFTPATVGLVAGLNGAGSAGNGGLATAAQLNYPVGIAYDSSGNLFVADESNYVVRRIDHITGDISVFAGTNATFGDSLGGGVATSAKIGSVAGLVIDTSNNVYVSDRSNNVVWKITSGGTISVYAGGGTSGLGDGGLATAAELNNPWALGIDASNNIYIADSYNDLVRVVNHSTNIITTFAGDIADANSFGSCSAGSLYSTSTPPYTPTQAHLCFPEGIAFDSSGNAYLVDVGNKVVRIVNKSTGFISTFAGGGTQAASVNNISATSASMTPSGVFVDPGNRVYIADSGGNLVRVVDSTGNINTVYGTGFGDLTAAAIGLPDTEALGTTVGVADGIYDMAMDTFGDLIAASSSGSAITSAGSSSGQYRFPQVPIFTTETTTQANTASPFYPPYITISNPSGVTLNFTAAPVVTGPFAVVTGAGAGTCVFPSGSVAPGQSCTVVLSFTPTLGGSPGTVQTGTVVIASNANSSPSTILLYGTGTGTATVSATLTTSPLTFTSPANITSAAQNATLTNTGQIPIAVGSTDFDFASASNFAVSATTCPSGAATLAVGASCTYSITFTPTAATTYSAGFQACVSTSSYGCLSIVVQGTGTAGATATLLPTALAFGSVYVGQTSAAASATLTNTGGSAISISGFTIGGTNPADFAVSTGTNACGSTLAAGANCNVYVTFTPASAASFSAQLSVTDSAASSPQTVALSGSGIRFVSNVGTALAAQAVTVVLSTAGTPATINVLTLGAPNLDFTLASGGTCSTSTAYTLGQTCTVNVVFDPTYPGPRYGAIVLTNSSGVAIGTANLIGTGNGPQIGFTQGTQSASLGSGFDNPIDVAVDGTGNIYVADFTNNAVKEIVAAGGYTTVKTLGSGFFEPSGVAVDGSGNVYVTDFFHKFVKEILAVNGTIPASPTIVTLGSGFNGPAGVAVDGNGNVFVADSFNNAVYELLAVNGSVPASPTILTLGSGFNGPTAVAVDASGDLFIADSGHNAVKEIVAVNGSIPASSPTINTLGSGFTQPQGIAVDAIGDVFVADTGNNAIKELVAVSGSIPATPTILSLGTVNDFAQPRGVAVDGHGNVLVPDYGDNRVVELDYTDPPAVAFGQVGAVKSQNVSIYNGGNQPLTLTNIAAAGTGFSYAPASTSPCALNTPMASGATCQVTVTLTTPNAGFYAGTLTYTDNSLNSAGSTQVIPLSGMEFGINVVASPTSLNFGNQAVGTTSAAQTITLTNYGDAYSAVINPVGGGGPFNFALGNCAASALAPATSASSPGGSCQLSVTFSPTTTNVYNNTSVGIVASNAGLPNVTLDVTVSGIGTSGSSPVETLSPTSLIFPNVTVGTTSAAQPVTVTNTGTALLSGIVPTLGGANALQYAISSNSCPGGLAPAASCVINITYTPTNTSGASATLSVATNAGNSPQSVILTGSGVTAAAPLAVLLPNPLTFPTTTVGVAATSLPLTISNPGNAALAISNVAISGTNAGSFSQSNNCGTSLAAGSSCTATVSFTPLSAGTLIATISVYDNATGSPQAVTIDGTGAGPAAPLATLNPTALTFPSTTVGVAATPLPITLSNPGTAALAITGISVGGANASSFGQTNTCGASVAAGASCTITVSFTPGSTGTLAASISIVDNASGSPQSVALTGTAVGSGGATFTVSTSTPSASVQPGGVAQYNLVIAPVGGSYTNVVTLSATGLPAGAQATFLPPTVTPGAAGAPSVLSIQTATGVARLAAPERRGQTSVPLLALLAGLPLLGFAGATRKLRKSAGRWMLLGFAVLSVLPLLALSGCGGGYFGPAPQTFTVTVVGTSGALQQTTTISLTVQ